MAVKEREAHQAAAEKKRNERNDDDARFKTGIEEAKAEQAERKEIHGIVCRPKVAEGGDDRNYGGNQHQPYSNGAEPEPHFQKAVVGLAKAPAEVVGNRFDMCGGPKRFVAVAEPKALAGIVNDFGPNI